MSTLSTHVLDAALGLPAVGVAVRLDDADGRWLASAETDADGRIRFADEVDGGVHRLTFDTAAYFTTRPHLHPEITVAFDVDPGQPHHHVALLLSPYSYTTYRGS